MLLAGAGVLSLLLAATPVSRFAGALLVALVLASRPPEPQHGALEVWIMDVGQGLAVLARTRHFVLLYDTGPAFGESSAADRIVLGRTGGNRCSASRSCT